MTSDLGNIAHRNLNNDTGGSNHHNFMIVIYRFDAHNTAGFFSDLIATQSLTSSLLEPELIQFIANIARKLLNPQWRAQALEAKTPEQLNALFEE